MSPLISIDLDRLPVLYAISLYCLKNGALKLLTSPNLEADLGMMIAQHPNSCVMQSSVIIWSCLIGFAPFFCFSNVDSDLIFFKICLLSNPIYKLWQMPLSNPFLMVELGLMSAPSSCSCSITYQTTSPTLALNWSLPELPSIRFLSRVRLSSDCSS